jgi:hypothetical protein
LRRKRIYIKQWGRLATILGPQKDSNVGSKGKETVSLVQKHAKEAYYLARVESHCKLHMSCYPPTVREKVEAME